MQRVWVVDVISPQFVISYMFKMAAIYKWLMRVKTKHAPLRLTQNVYIVPQYIILFNILLKLTAIVNHTYLI